MELGIFIQSPVYSHHKNVPDPEHLRIKQDLEATIAADAAGFKYVAASEHHFLDEYSHLSANDIVMGYLAHATKDIHLLSGIMNPLPQVIHPAKLAETVAMLDHVSEGRFEFGTGRGAGSYEILGFLDFIGITDTSQTREIWEDVIAEFPKMWMQEEYEGYKGKYWSLPPRKILPKPYKKPHPPMWYACGNTSSYEMCARRGLGALGFSVQALSGLEAVINTYKSAIRNAEPVGAYVNDNVLIAGAAFVSEDPERAIAAVCSDEYQEMIANVYRYHDTFPHPDHIPQWPERLPRLSREALPTMRENGTIVGDPDHAVEQLKRWEAAGADQFVFSVGWQPHELTMETIRLFGEYIIPKIDRDPVHRTTRMRESASA